MRHRKAGRKLNMDASARKAMWRNMVTSLMLHGQIRTTEHRAKELRRYADRVISIGKRAPSEASLSGMSGDELQRARAARVAAIRRARLWINNDEALRRVFDEYAHRFQTRPGGYTRVLKMGRRAGDNAAMALVQVVEEWTPGAPSSAQGDVAPSETSEAPPAVEPDTGDEAAADAADDPVEDSVEDAAEDAVEDSVEDAVEDSVEEAADAPSADDGAESAEQAPSDAEAPEDFADEDEEVTVVAERPEDPPADLADASDDDKE